jgi:hypothetical protein
VAFVVDHEDRLHGGENTPAARPLRTAV